MPVAFAETDAEEIENILQTVCSNFPAQAVIDPSQNLLWTLHLARVILPTMIMRKPKSLILNIGSLNGRIPPPLTAAYGCTKGGLQIWSRALAEEVKQQGVLVYMVLPAFVVRSPIFTEGRRLMRCSCRSRTCPRSAEPPSSSPPPPRGSIPHSPPSVSREAHKVDRTR